jgi:hypothetical protein
VPRISKPMGARVEVVVELLTRLASGELDARDEHRRRRCVPTAGSPTPPTGKPASAAAVAARSASALPTDRCVRNAPRIDR